MWSIPTQYKMAGRDDDCRAMRANLAQGQARMLIEAPKAIENRRGEVRKCSEGKQE